MPRHVNSKTFSNEASIFGYEVVYSSLPPLNTEKFNNDTLSNCNTLILISEIKTWALFK